MSVLEPTHTGIPSPSSLALATSKQHRALLVVSTPTPREIFYPPNIETPAVRSLSAKKKISHLGARPTPESCVHYVFAIRMCRWQMSSPTS